MDSDPRSPIIGSSAVVILYFMSSRQFLCNVEQLLTDLLPIHNLVTQRLYETSRIAPTRYHWRPLKYNLDYLGIVLL